jgi:hypothetical protein
MKDHENEGHFHEASYSINLAAWAARGWAEMRTLVQSINHCANIAFQRKDPPSQFTWQCQRNPSFCLCPDRNSLSIRK